MIEPLKSERVIVDRGIGDKFLANTTHQLFADKMDERTKQIVKGDFLGIGVRDDRGHELYAQPNQLAPAGA